MRFRNPVLLVLACLTCLVAIPTARADIFFAYGWQTTDAIAMSASPASLTNPNCYAGVGGGPCTPTNHDVFFTTNDFPFFDLEFAGTVGEWLASSAHPINNVVDNIVNSPMSPTIWEIKGFLSLTGTVANPQYFTILHDDGVSLALDGQFFLQPGPSATPELSMLAVAFTGGPANVTFDLIYAECCEGPARLEMTPEPGAIVLLGTVLLALGPMIKRKIASRIHS